jgi:biotin transport system substrate-specific component
MANAHGAPLTFAEALWPSRGASRPLRALLLAVLGSALLTISAKIEVPFYPVPMTMQTLVVLLLGMAFGARLATAAVLLYLAEGAVGLPVFAGTPERGIGIAYMLGPTGGYLVGFVLSAAITGWLTERRRDWQALVLAVTAGSIVVFIPGVLWLAHLIGFEQSIAHGLMPFLWGTLVKGAIAVALGMAGAAMIQKRLQDQR